VTPNKKPRQAGAFSLTAAAGQNREAMAVEKKLIQAQTIKATTRVKGKLALLNISMTYTSSQN
jgi:hypothetical protein